MPVTMPAIRTPTLHCSLKSSLSSILGFPATCEERGSFIDLFSNYCPEDLFTSSDEFNCAPLNQSHPHWIESSPLLSALDEHESVSPGMPHPFTMHPFDSQHYILPGTPIDTKPFDWSYDASSSTSGSPHLGLTMDGGFGGLSLSPSISITSCSPLSEVEMLPPSRDFNEGIQFTHCYPNPASHPSMNQSHWSTSPSPRFSNSPSPSPSSYDAKRTASRELSPDRSETEKADRRRFPCLILGCDRRFTSQYTLKVHMEAHKPKPKVTFECTEGCQERFSRQHDRLRHEVAKHGKVCEFLCEDCSRFFSTKKTLGNHKCPVAKGGTRWISS